MKKKSGLFCYTIIVILLLSGCSYNQIPPVNFASDISLKLFYEYWGFSGYKTKVLKIEDGLISESPEKWERGYIKAIPVDPAEDLAKTLGFQNYEELLFSYGQLYQYQNYPIGKIYTFFGNYNHSKNYTVFIWNSNGIYKIEFPDTDYSFHDLQLNENKLYLILSEYTEEEEQPGDDIFVYEIDPITYTYTNYTLHCGTDVIMGRTDYLIHNHKLYVAYASYFAGTADSYIGVMDLKTGHTSFSKKPGVANVSLLRANNYPVAIFGKIKDGSPVLPPHLEYYDEELNVVDAKTLNLYNDNYMTYLGDYLILDDILYCVLDSKKGRKCLYVVYNMATGETVYTKEIKPPVKDAIMQKTIFLLKSNGEYYNLF